LLELLLLSLSDVLALLGLFSLTGLSAWLSFNADGN
jgi:hypothetical protein